MRKVFKVRQEKLAEYRNCFGCCKSSLSYLDQVRKAVNEKEAAEWLYVERAKDTAAEQPVEPATQPAITDAEFAAQNLVPGETVFEIDGRTFLVDRVDTAHGVVNFQDITFVQKVGFPIFRTEPISFVRKIVEQAAPAALAPPQPQTDEPPAVLTPPKKKKQNALAYYAEGYAVKDISGLLFISVGTVKGHNSHIYSKLGVDSYDSLKAYLDVLRRCERLEELLQGGGK